MVSFNVFVREGTELAEKRIVDVEGCSQEDRFYYWVSPARNADEDNHDSNGGAFDPIERHQ